MRIIGIDPGLRHTGWGIIDKQGSKLSYIASGIIHTNASDSDALRLADIDFALENIIQKFRPDHAAIEETFVNKNPTSTLKLGQARGIALMVPARNKLSVFEYSANKIKKSVVGAGHAGKDQIAMMVGMLLPLSKKGAKHVQADEADALAIAICHAHHADFHALQRA